MTTGVSQLGRAEVGLKPGSGAPEFELLAWRSHSEETPLDSGLETVPFLGPRLKVVFSAFCSVNSSTRLLETDGIVDVFSQEAPGAVLCSAVYRESLSVHFSWTDAG